MVGMVFEPGAAGGRCSETSELSRLPRQNLYRSTGELEKARVIKM